MGTRNCLINQTYSFILQHINNNNNNNNHARTPYDWRCYLYIYMHVEAQAHNETQEDLFLVQYYIQRTGKIIFLLSAFLFL